MGEELVLDAVLTWEAVKRLNDGGDVFSGPGGSEKTGSAVLNAMQFLEMSRGMYTEKAVKVIKLMKAWIRISSAEVGMSN